jgi:arylsulfatase A-like enzyme
MIFEPGRDTGMHVHAPTSAADVLPTLMHVSGKQAPDWSDGIVMPPFSGVDEDADRNIYVVRATRNDVNGPLRRASTMLVKGHYKLLYFFGYQDLNIDDHVVLYDLQSDPEELVDLSSSEKKITEELLDELRKKLTEVDRPFLGD